jgi:hypothetical protein
VIFKVENSICYFRFGKIKNNEMIMYECPDKEYLMIDTVDYGSGSYDGKSPMVTDEVNFFMDNHYGVSFDDVNS